MEFCLEDGTPLVLMPQPQAEETLLKKPLRPTFPASPNAPLTEILPQNSLPLTQPSPQPPETIEQKTILTSPKTAVIKEQVVHQGSKVLEILPIIFALMQNYWQWLYFSRPADFEFPQFLWSTNFLVWLVLFLCGIGFSISALKFVKNRGFAIVSLVILAINFILCVVPRK